MDEAPVSFSMEGHVTEETGDQKEQLHAKGMADQVNNELAVSISNLSMADQSHAFILSAIAIMVIVPAVWHSRVVRGRGKIR